MEQEKQTQPEQKKKRLSTPLLIFIILMAVTLTLCAVVAGIWLHGRSSFCSWWVLHRAAYSACRSARVIS